MCGTMHKQDEVLCLLGYTLLTNAAVCPAREVDICSYCSAYTQGDCSGRAASIHIVGSCHTLEWGVNKASQYNWAA